jgi:cytochrome P450
MFPISLDPPEHGIYRAALAPIFGPKAMNMLRADIRRLAVDLILPVIPRGRCDFLKEVAEPLPVTIFLTLMGMPLDRLHEFRNLAVRAVEAQSADVFAEVAAINAEIIRARQGSDGDDIVSRLWRSDINGRPPTFDEMGSICLLLFIGGLDTVVNGLGFAIRHLARDQELQARLRSDPGLIPEAVEEILRMYGIAQTQRVLTRNAEYEGVNFREGDVVLCLVSAANRDPEAFVDPDTAKLGRDGAHLTFNTGIHRCLGSHLARIELQTVYEEWLQRVPTFTLDREHSPLAHAGRIMGLRSVPVVWNTSS